MTGMPISCTAGKRWEASVSFMGNVIFLDIDGVLNSVIYDRERAQTDGNIDVSRLPLLKRILDAADAQVVLSSSWRKHWDRNPAIRDRIGQELDSTFLQAGIVIADKTPAADSRREEIALWLSAHPQVANYVILDDTFGGWGDLAEHVVKTDSRIGRGLQERHVEAAIRILRKR